MKKNFIMILSALFCLCIIPGVGKGFGEVLVSEVFSGNIQVQGDYLFWSDDSENPVNKIPITGGTITPLAMKMGIPVNMTIHGQDIFWVDSRDGYSPSYYVSPTGCVGMGVWIVLNRTSLDGTSTIALAEGDACYGGGDMIVHEENVYWVNSTASPPTYTIEKVPISGGDTTILVSSMKPIIDMKHDATHLYWLEADFPISAAIKRIPLGGGETIVLYSVPEFVSHSIPAFLIHDTEIVFIDKSWPEASSILKIPISGGPVTTLADLPNTPRKMVISGEYLYWIDDSTIKRIPLVGGEVTTLASGLDSPEDILIDSGTIIWSEVDSVKKIPLEGGNITTLATGLTSPILVGVDLGYLILAEGGYIGDTIEYNKNIKKVPLTGGEITALVEGIEDPGLTILESSSIYWIESGPYAAIEGRGKIAKVSVAGGLVTIVASGISNPFPRISVDNTNIYIADKWTIKKVSVDGGPVEKLVTGDFYLQDLITDGAFVYWIENPFSKICRFPINGGTTETLASGFGGPPGPIRLDNTYVYWMDHYDMINKVPKTGGTIVTIVSDFPFLDDFVVDGTYVYFSDCSGYINKVSVDGGPISQLAYSSSSFTPNILAVDDLNIYWVNQYYISRVPKEGGTQTVIQGDLETYPYPNSIAVDGTHIYWTETGKGTINRIAKPSPIDPIPPETSITGGPSGNITTNNPTFTFTGTDNLTPKASLVYATYLQGYDIGWSGFSSSTTKSYSGLPNGAYVFQVKARDQEGNVDPTPATRSFTVSIAPPPPTNVSASDGTYLDRVEVTWTASLEATSYTVYRATSTNRWAKKTTLGTTSDTFFNDTTAVPMTTYYYYVKASNVYGTSNFSAYDAGYRSDGSPAAPTNISASDGTYMDKVEVTWEASTMATSYTVYRATSLSRRASKTTLGSTSELYFNDTTAIPKTTYYYYIKASNAYGTSDFSAYDAGYRSDGTPPIPTNVAASDGIYVDRVEVTWTASLGATSYTVYRATSTNRWAKKTTLGTTSETFFNDTTASIGVTYYYYVTASNSYGTSSYSTYDTGHR